MKANCFPVLMPLMLVALLCLSTSVIGEIAASKQHPHDANTDDPFGQSYLQLRETFYAAEDAPVAERLKILAEIEKEARLAGGSGFASSALIWVGQEYSTNGQPSRAIQVLKHVLSGKELPDQMRGVAQFELGLALSRADNGAAADEVWASILSDKTLNQIHLLAAEQLRSARLLRKDSKGAHEIATYELKNNLGSPPILLETSARCARDLKQFEDAQRDYQRILDEYPDFRPKNRMIYIEKAALTCKYKGIREQVGYLEEMSAVAEKYADSAEAFQEYYNIGLSYAVCAKSYSNRREAMPISEDEALSRALKAHIAAIEGIKNLPKAQRKNIEFEAVISGAYLSATELLVQMGREGEAMRLSEELLRLYPDLEPQRLAMVQRRLQCLLIGGQNIGDLPQVDLDDFPIDSISAAGSLDTMSRTASAPAGSSPKPNAAAKATKGRVDQSGAYNILNLIIPLGVAFIIAILVYFLRMRHRVS